MSILKNFLRLNIAESDDTETLEQSICKHTKTCEMCGKHVCEHCYTETSAGTILCNDRCAKLGNDLNDIPPAIDSMENLDDNFYAEWKTCDKCSLHCSRNQVVLGTGNKIDPKIFIVGQAPGEVEDLQGKPFVGPVSWHLDQVLKSVGIDRENDCYLTNAIACRPWIPQINKNRTPTTSEITTCRPRLVEEFGRVFSSVKVVVLVGKEAYMTWMLNKPMRQRDFNSDKIRVGAILGWQKDLPEDYPKAYVVYHPSYVARRGPDAIDRSTNKKLAVSWRDDWEAIAEFVNTSKVTTPRS